MERKISKREIESIDPSIFIIENISNIKKGLTDYEPEDVKLGAGNYATVTRACKKSKTNVERDCKYAIKPLEISGALDIPPSIDKIWCLNSSENAAREINISLRMSDLGIGPKIYEVAYDDKFAYIIMDQYDGNLFDLEFELNNPAEFAKIIEQVKILIAAMHKAGVIHRDLKLDNILYRKIRSGDSDIYQFAIADYGAAFWSTNPRLQELDYKRLYNSYYDVPVDFTRGGKQCVDWL